MRAKWTEMFNTLPREVGVNFRKMSRSEKISFLKREEIPSKNLCLLMGVGELVHDYPHKSVHQFSGEATIQMDNGSVWKAQGVPSEGSGGVLWKESYIKLSKGEGK